MAKDARETAKEQKGLRSPESFNSKTPSHDAQGSGRPAHSSGQALAKLPERRNKMLRCPKKWKSACKLAGAGDAPRGSLEKHKVKLLRLHDIHEI